MKAIVWPGKLQGTLPAVQSKSHGHRLLLAAGLSESPSTLLLDAKGQDLQATLSCLEALGASTERMADGLRITPISQGCRHNPLVLDCGESGSTLRFLLPVACALGVEGRIIGQGRLPERPLGPLLQGMQRHGVRIEGQGLPLRISGQLQGGDFELPGDVSSQYLTGLLFALPLLAQDSRIRLTTGLSSRGYVNMTLETLRCFGIALEEVPQGYSIPGRQKYQAPERLAVEGDWSSALYWHVANCLGSAVRVEGLEDGSHQPDRQASQWLQALSNPGHCTLSFEEAPDSMPALAVAATQGPGTTRLTGMGRLKWKESDRVAAMYQGLTRLGAKIQTHGEDWVLTGGQQLQEGIVEGYGDHRIVMALAIAATVASGPVCISDAEAVAKSYPDFWKDFAKLGGRVHVQ